MALSCRQLRKQNRMQTVWTLSLQLRPHSSACWFNVTQGMCTAAGKATIALGWTKMAMTAR